MPDTARVTQARSSFWLPLVLLLAVGLRVALSLHKGLVLDEFHSYFHVTREGLGAFFETLRRDNHPPLTFLIIAGGRNLLGDEAWALRLPALLCGVVEVLLVARLARPLGRERAALAALLVALSTLHLDWSTQVRMYAFLSLAVTGVTVALVEHLEGAPARRRWLVAWVVFGFHSHYYTVHYCLVLGAGAVLLGLLARELRPRVLALLPAGGIALLLCAPWMVFGLREQLSHALPPGGDDTGLLALAQGMGHLFHINVSFAGAARGAIIASAGGLLLLSAWGALVGLREQRRRAAILVMGGFVTPVFAMALAMLWSRGGFTWNYILPSLAPVAVLAAWGVGPGPLLRVRRVLLAYGVASLVWLAGLHLVQPGSEDFPGAVARVLELYAPGDVIVSVEQQPTLFPQGQPWDYYAPRLSDDPPPRAAMLAGEFDVVDRDELRRARRVIVLVSRLPHDHAVRRWLSEQGREITLEEPFGYGRRVVVYE